MSTPDHTTKSCTNCKVEYPCTAEYFPSNKRCRDGFDSWCHKCHSTASMRWQNDHIEQEKERKAKWAENNYDKKKSYDAGWIKDHPEYNRARVSRRRARKIGLPDTWTDNDEQRCLEYFDHKCAVCGRPRGLFHTLAMDHWIPLDSPNCPGTIPTNMIPLCHGRGGCNNSKGKKMPHEWLVTKFGERKAKQIEKRIIDYFESIVIQ